jgi:hypothetical protein
MIDKNEHERKDLNRKLLKNTFKAEMKKSRYDKATRNRNLIKRIIDIVIVFVAVGIADVLSYKYFDDSFWIQVLLIIIIEVLFIPIDLIIEKKYFSS